MADIDLDRIREQTLLKTLLESPDNTNIIYQISDTLKYSHFKINTFAYIYKAIIEIASKSGHPDYITVAENIKQAGLGEVCTPQAVMNLQNVSAELLNIKSAQGYAEEIRTTFQVYQAKVSSDRIGEANTLAEIKMHYAELGRALDASSSKPFSRAEKDVYAVYEEIGEHRNNRQNGLYTGYVRLDGMMGGLLPGEVTVIGGRPGTGKSTFALGIAWKISSKARVGFTSVEMGRAGLFMKMFGMCSGVPLIKLRQGLLSDAEYEKLATCIERIASHGLTFDFHAMEIDEIVMRTRRMVAEDDIKVLVIDYLQLIRCNYGDNKEQRVAHVSNTLKRLAKDLNIHIVVLSQLNREFAKRADHRPHLEDLRSSGEIEQDCDFAILMWRGEDERGCHLDLAKSRAVGNTGTFDLAFDTGKGWYVNG